MCSGLPCNDSSIRVHFNSDLAGLNEQLESLEDARYVEWNGTEYEASALGREVIRQTGIEMLHMDRFRMTGDLQRSERLLNKLERGK